jgi:hypothetical protein
MFAVQTATVASRAKANILATVLQRQFTHEGRHKPSPRLVHGFDSRTRCQCLLPMK